MSSVTSEVLFYYEASPLSSGKFLQRVYEFIEEIAFFLGEENKSEGENYSDGLFVLIFSYLVDIFLKLNCLNLQFHGEKMIILRDESQTVGNSPLA